jgi:hypothetical protein
LQILQKETVNCITGEDFLETSEESVGVMLAQDELSISETLLVSAVEHWARREAQRRNLGADDVAVRQVLEPHLLHCLRFLSMTHEEFACGPGVSDWLKDEEKKAIYAYWKNPQSLPDLPEPLSKLCHPRITSKITQCPRTKIYQSIFPKQVSDSEETTFNHEEHPYIVFKFTGREVITLLGVTVMSQVKDWTDKTFYEEELCLCIKKYIREENKWIKLSEVYYNSIINLNSTVPISFDSPVQIKQGEWYAIYAHFYVPGSYPLVTRQRNVSSAGVEFQCSRRNGKFAGFFESLLFEF